MKIWEFNLVYPGRTELDIPAGGEVLAAQLRRDILVMWVLLDPDRPLVSRTFDVYTHGQEIDCHPGRYVSSFQRDRLNDRPLVFHVFESR